MCASVCVFARTCECVRLCESVFEDVCVSLSSLVRGCVNVFVSVCMHVRSYTNACVFMFQCGDENRAL